MISFNGVLTVKFGLTVVALNVLSGVVLLTQSLYGGLVQFGRGIAFKPQTVTVRVCYPLFKNFRDIAQLVESVSYIHQVIGSIPIIPILKSRSLKRAVKIKSYV